MELLVRIVVAISRAEVSTTISDTAQRILGVKIGAGYGVVSAIRVDFFGS